MEYLEKFGDWFTAFTAWLERALTRLFGSSNERRIRQLGFIRESDGSSRIVSGSLLEKINNLEPEVEKLSDDELHESTAMFRRRLAEGETVDDLLPEAFARVRESARRFVKMRHYDVQMIGGIILHRGMISEMSTGEGKTLVATAPAYLNGLAGHVHVVTVNDYLARRDMEWMGPIYLGLGMTVGAIQSQMNPHERQEHYSCDITYGTNNEFGFDYLRDNMKRSAAMQVQGPLDYAIVDEIDNILIDEARTPLIISGPAHDDVSKYSRADRIARQLVRDEDFEVKEKERTAHLTESGVRRAEQLAEVDSFYTAGNMEWPHLIDNALKAHHLYRRDVEYMVKGQDIIIVDEHTGRPMHGRQWSDGLHQAVEAKEHVEVKPENQTLATITLQNYFKLYDKLCGMTGTAMTEAGEFYKIYKLDVLNVPTNRPEQRQHKPDVIYKSEKEKWTAVAEDVRDEHATGRPILIGTTNIETSEILSRKLERFGIKHHVLNAKYIEKEAELIAQAGRQGAVTIATNMAGRGTDIILGGNPEYLAWEELRRTYASRLDVSKSEWDSLTNSIAEREGMAKEGREVAEAGGLYVIGTERHDSRRIDNQLRGRTGRQGDPGTSRFYLSLEDKLLRVFAGEWVQSMFSYLGMEEGEAIESKMVTRRVEGAQKKVEERHFDQRKHLLDYDEVMDEQRKRVYSFRQQILDGGDCRQIILDMIRRQVSHSVEHFLRPEYRWESIAAFVEQAYRIETDSRHVKDMTYEDLVDFLSEEAFTQAEEQIAEQIEENLPEEAEEKEDWNWTALSRWANAFFQLNTNERELKKVGRDGLQEHLRERARVMIEKFDFSPLKQFLEEDFPLENLRGWLAHQFTAKFEAEDFRDQDADEVEALAMKRLEEMYQEKEVLFPVAVGMTKYMGQSPVPGGERYDRDGLAHWAQGRFETEFDTSSVRMKPRHEIERLLTDISRRYFINGEVAVTVDRYLDEAYDERESKVDHPEKLAELLNWANEEFRAHLETGDVAVLPKQAARQKVLQHYELRYRPELSTAERALVLEVLDVAWKEHLYYMDHLRSGIGLVGYAQKDPKVEYKREGRKAFIAMWDRIDEQVTGAIFRLEKESPAFVGELWNVTSEAHAAPTEAPPEQEQQYEENGAELEPGAEEKAVEPIRNSQPKVGRNDPCPCGSGKKYKKCCGAG